jgi:hypothetical protein
MSPLAAKRGFALLVGLQVGLCAAAALWRPELRLFAVLGITLCLTLMAGLLYRPTRWLAAGLTLPLLGLLTYLVFQFVEWSRA